MSSGLSPENEQFLDRAVACGIFPGRTQAIDQAVDMLRKRQELLDHIDEGTRQLRSGQYTDYDDEGLRQFFEEVKAEGRRRLEASKRTP
jgi:Arc/MetJ-type ribon-helix-helix transcriptional regulator